MENYGFWSAEIPDGQIRKLNEVQSKEYQDRIANARIIRNETKVEGKHIGFFTEFPSKKNEEVTLKVGISFTDMAGAETYNGQLSTENPGTDVSSIIQIS